MMVGEGMKAIMYIVKWVAGTRSEAWKMVGYGYGGSTPMLVNETWLETMRLMNKKATLCHLDTMKRLLAIEWWADPKSRDCTSGTFSGMFRNVRTNAECSETIHYQFANGIHYNEDLLEQSTDRNCICTTWSMTSISWSLDFVLCPLLVDFWLPNLMAHPASLIHYNTIASQRLFKHLYYWAYKWVWSIHIP